MNLPVIPKRGQPITAAALAAVEQQIATEIDMIDDRDWLEETLAQARALESYLRDKEMQAPMLGAQRRIEARIGQLLGEAKPGPKQSSVVTEVSSKDDRSDFRLLAKAMNGASILSFDEWRKSRRALVKLVRQRMASDDWTPDQSARRRIAEKGGVAVASMRNDAAGLPRDRALIGWAETSGRLIRIDRGTAWGNPFILNDDGDRDTVLANYAWYLDHKPSLLKLLPILPGKVLACWCYPDRCHGDMICLRVVP